MTQFTDSFSEEVWESTYKNHKDNNIDDSFRRVAKAVAGAEKTSELKQIWEDNFFKLLEGFNFVPGGRILSNAGTEGTTTLYNCFVSAVQDLDIEDADSIKGIYTMLGKQAETLKSEGGYGINASWIRPEGSFVKGINSRTPGVLKFMELWDKSSEIITAGSIKVLGETKKEQKKKIRKGAQMLVLECWHPEIREFITVKQTPGRLTKFNVSVGITEGFMNAVHNDELWELKFPDTTSPEYKTFWKGNIDDWIAKGFPVIVYEKIKAKELWESIMKSTYNRAEPGVLFIDTINRLNPINYAENVRVSNPCIIGSTLIATADGRNAVSIQQLVSEGKDVPVYSHNVESGQLEIKWGRNPRLTGSKQEVWKLTLDDNSTLIATPNHKILTKKYGYKNLKDLQNGDSIVPFNSFNSNKYRQITNSGQTLNKETEQRRNRRQYRLIHEFHYGITEAKKFAIHHKDFNSLNDSISNLEVMSHENHRTLHADKMKGLNNPYFKMSEEWKHNFAFHKGEANGRYIKVSNEDLIDIAKKLFEEKGSLTKKSWKEYTLENNLPCYLANECRFGSWGNFKNQVTTNHKVISVEFYGYEDVYNITVDDNHNYHVITSFEDDNYVVSSGICIKNCGEIPMSTGVCCLGSLNLTQYIKKDIHDNYTFDYDKFRKYVSYGIRFLDDVLEISNTPLEEYLTSVQNKRRIGLGVMGLGSLHYILGIKFASPESLDLVKNIFKIKAETELLYSAKLGQEKGSFLQFEKEKHFNTLWWNTLDISSDIKKEIKNIGEMRNSHQSMNAPTGNTGILANNTSGGIEPIFLEEYYRWSIVNEIDQKELLDEGFLFPLVSKSQWFETEYLKFSKTTDEEILVGEYKGVPYQVDKSRGLIKGTILRDYGWNFVKQNFSEEKINELKNKNVFTTTKDMTVEDHCNVLALISHYTNQACSKTINVPNDYPYEKFADIYSFSYQNNIKGITTYREGTMLAVLSDTSKKEEKSEVTKVRPKEVPCSIYHLKIKGEAYFVVVGLLNNLPYEVFAGRNNQPEFDKREKEGFIIKQKKGIYLLTNRNKEVILDNLALHITDEQEAMTRMISALLQQGADINRVVSILEKTKGELGGFSKAQSRILKHYIPDGTKIEEECPECGHSHLERREGCTTCPNCSWSKCG